MSTNNDYGSDPAFPNPDLGVRDFSDCGAYPGMNLRQYAAIKLRVPSSGTDWLDDMIRESLRNELAAKAMQAVPMPQPSLHDTPYAYDRIASHAYKMADAMLRAREGGAA